MSRYRRFYCPGGTYFFTVVTYKRRPIFEDPVAREILRVAFDEVRAKRPFDIPAMCLLLDHIHCVWRMPEGDADFPARWSAVKGAFSRAYNRRFCYRGEQSLSRNRKGEASFWQRRYWEHTIRSEDELERVFDYIHYNPVKHGLVARASDWPWSSLQRFIKQGFCEEAWGGETNEWMVSLPCAGE